MTVNRLLALVLCIGWIRAQNLNGRSNLVPCAGANRPLKYLHGDALTGSTTCLGPDGQPYPTEAVKQVLPMSRKGRSSKLVDPFETKKKLLAAYEATNFADSPALFRHERSVVTENEAYFGEGQSRRRPVSDSNKNSASSACSGPGNRLCKTRYNTTAPLYGVSLTSGQPVTIVQKFPDLLQQVIYEVCDSKECDVVHGECVQTYVPYLFLVIPLGPVTLTGQDYVLVENGCVCRPKYAKGSLESTISEAVPGMTLP